MNGFTSLLVDGDERRLIQPAAILRLAEFLERGRNANIDDIRAHWEDTTIFLALDADEFPAVEIWEAERNAVDLMSKAFDRRVVVESTAAPGIGAALIDLDPPDGTERFVDL